MFNYLCGQRHMLAHHDSVLDKGQMDNLWKTGAPITCSNIECEKFDRRNLDLTFAKHGLEGSYDFFWFEDATDHTLYPMFASDAAKLLKNDQLRLNISGTFKMVRHGTHFGIELV